MSGWFTSFLNCRLCINGELVRDQLVVSDDTGLILPKTGYIGGDAVDLEDAIIAPGFLDLQSNGFLGFHFTTFRDPQSYAAEIDKVSRYLVSHGVTGFWPTLPTISSDQFKQVLPSLQPREIDNGAAVLGAHAEGPYLHPDKKGAHNASLFAPATQLLTETYGPSGDSSSILKIVTLAPDIDSSEQLIARLAAQGTRVSLGHSPASFEQGMAALRAGATCLTHTMNAMAPLTQRNPGLAGLITTDAAPYFSFIADGLHLHPSIAALLFRANPSRALVITDAIELLGLPDGVYPGHAQIPHPQRKAGSRVTIDGTDTLVGGCETLAGCIRNLMAWTGCDVAAAVRCVTENVADLMGLADRGKLEVGRRADFVVLDDAGNVLQTWIAGRKVWDSAAG